MSTPWQAVLSSTSEKEAFFSLLDEYWARDPATAATPAAPRARVVAPPAPHSSYTPTAPTPRHPPAPTSSPGTSASTFIADRALQNTTATSAALRNAGLSAGAASTLSKFGATHHEKLAPHVAAGAKAGWANRANVGGQVEAEPAPKGPPVSLRFQGEAPGLCEPFSSPTAKGTQATSRALPIKVHGRRI